MGGTGFYLTITGLDIDEDDTVTFVTTGLDSYQYIKLCSIDSSGNFTFISEAPGIPNPRRMSFNKAMRAPNNEIVAVGKTYTSLEELFGAQLDIELSFTSQEEVFDLLGWLTASIFQEILQQDLPTPFPRLSYAEAMNRFGCDKPDLRFGLELIDFTEFFAAVTKLQQLMIACINMLRTVHFKQDIPI